jgi:hypothetical protein
VNKEREGKNYINKDAGNKIRGNSSMKAPLTESSFIVEFEYGANNQGYWDYDHMIIQFEDCIDVIQTLHPEFEFIFHFDHSCGHDRQQLDGLSVPKVNKSFGGTQPKMRKSKIEAEEFLGPFEAILKVGDYQHMVFQEEDLGPFNMSEADREASKFDCQTGDTTTKKRRKDAIENDLKAKGVRARGSRNVIVRLCEQNDIPHEITTEKIKEGWGGNQRGCSRYFGKGVSLTLPLNQ